jgi:hypothetical protein
MSPLLGPSPYLKATRLRADQNILPGSQLPCLLLPIPNSGPFNTDSKKPEEPEGICLGLWEGRESCKAPVLHSFALWIQTLLKI